ncbi:MAG: hypothetical protein KAK00_04785 [Nanoarchaeota archaeon]|nr:hypothetical protein [Nanoarchaeota archaeon]
MIIRKAKIKDISHLLVLWEGLMQYHKDLDKKAFTTWKKMGFTEGAKSIFKSIK